MGVIRKRAAKFNSALVFGSKLTIAESDRGELLQWIDGLKTLPNRWREKTMYPDDFIDQTERELVDCSVDRALRYCADELDKTLQQGNDDE